MSAYKQFAVAGAGSIGRVIVEELVKKKDEGKFSRLERNPPQPHPPKCSRNVFQAAGVKLFVPSQFDCDPCGKSEMLLLKHREVFRRNLKEIGLSYAVFCTGLLIDKVFAPTFAAALGLDFSSGEFSIPVSGTAPISWTTTEEVAQFIAHALTIFPREKIEWRTFRIEGEQINLNEIVALWEKRFRRTALVTHRPRAVIKTAVKLDATDFLSSFILDLDAGHMAVGDPEEVSDREFPRWRPKRVIDVLDDLYED
ncbi:hypothetical protein ACEPAI_3147 [Sanghuangporus weigelae]